MPFIPYGCKMQFEFELLINYRILTKCLSLCFIFMFFYPLYWYLWNWQLNKYSFRWFQHAAESFVKVPFFGAVSYLTLAVCPFCIAFSVVWAVFRRISFAWIGQDILVRWILICTCISYSCFHYFLKNFACLSTNVEFPFEFSSSDLWAICCCNSIFRVIQSLPSCSVCINQAFFVVLIKKRMNFYVIYIS